MAVTHHSTVFLPQLVEEPEILEDREEEQEALEMREATHHLKEIQEGQLWADRSLEAEAAEEPAALDKMAEVLLQALEVQELITTSQVLHILIVEVEQVNLLTHQVGVQLVQVFKQFMEKEHHHQEVVHVHQQME